MSTRSMRESAELYRQRVEARGAAIKKLRSAVRRLQKLAAPRTGSVLDEALRLLSTMDGDARLLRDSHKIETLLTVRRNHAAASPLLNELTGGLAWQCDQDVRMADSVRARIRVSTTVYKRISDQAAEVDASWLEKLHNLALSAPENADKMRALVRQNARIRREAADILEQAQRARVQTAREWLEDSLVEHQDAPKLRGQLALFENDVAEPSSEGSVMSATSRHQAMDDLVNRCSKTAWQESMNLIWNVTHHGFGREASRLGDPANYGTTRAAARDAQKGLKQFREIGARAEGLIKREDISAIELFWMLSARRLLRLGKPSLL